MSINYLNKINQNEKTPEEKLITSIILGFFYKEFRYTKWKNNKTRKIEIEVDPIKKEELNFTNSKLFKAFCDCRKDFSEEQLTEKITEKYKKDQEKINKLKQKYGS